MKKVSGKKCKKGAKLKYIGGGDIELQEIRVADKGRGALQQTPMQPIPNNIQMPQYQPVAYPAVNLQQLDADYNEPIGPPVDDTVYPPAEQQTQVPKRAKPRIGTSFNINTADIAAGLVAGINGLLPYQKPKDNKNLLIDGPTTANSGIAGSRAAFKKGGKMRAAEGITTPDRENWENMMSAWNKQDNVLNYTNLPDQGFMQQYGIDPARVADYQQDFQQLSTNDPIRVSGKKGFAPATGQMNAQTAQQRYRKFEYNQQRFDKATGDYQTYSSINTGTEPMSVQQWDDKLSPAAQSMTTRVQQPASGNDNLHVNNPGFLTREQALQKHKSKKNATLASNLEYGGAVPLSNGDTIGQLQVEDDKYSYLSPTMIKLNGDKHEQGGTDIAYQGTEVEAEKDESVAINNEGDAVVFGNLYVPGTNTKFKKAATDLGKQEMKTSKVKQKAALILNKFDDKTKYSAPTFNTGKVMSDAYQQRAAHDQEIKDYLVQTQDMMLNLSEQTGLDAKEVSKALSGKAKFGIKLAKGGKKMKGIISRDDENYGPDPNGADMPERSQSLAVRHNNPGNIKYGDFAKSLGAVQGEPATDGGYFAKFPSIEAGLKAIPALLRGKGYKNLTTEAAIKRYTNQAPYKVNLGDLSGKKISELSDDQMRKLTDIVTSGEDSKHYNLDGVVTPYNNVAPTPAPRLTVPRPDEQQELTQLNQDYPQSVQPWPEATPDNTGMFDIPKDIIQPKEHLNLTAANRKGKGMRNKFHLTDYLGEISSLMDNPEPVPSIQVNPILEPEYNISLQAKKNSVISAYKPAMEAARNNPAQQTAIAGQMAEQLASIDGEEFLYNQQNTGQIRARNLQELRGVRDVNTQLTADQMNKQVAARSITNDNKFGAASSIGTKEAQRRAQNNQLQMYEQYTGWAYGEDGKPIMLHPGYSFDNRMVSVDNPNDANRSTVTRKRKTANGEITEKEQERYFGGRIKKNSSNKK